MINIQLSVRFFLLYSVFNEHVTFFEKKGNQRNFTLIFVYQCKFGVAIPLSERQLAVVGPSGLEPPTSCLSGTRSNLLSYEPLWLVK